MVITNIPYFGAGMKVAPDASPNDGVLEVVFMGRAPKLVFLRLLLMIRTAHIANFIKLALAVPPTL
jgi:diacylglycerol kinase family enzyme